MVERRDGGETGVSAVHCLEGSAVWKAGQNGIWSRELAAAADARITLKKPGNMEYNCKNPILFLLEYVDGFKAATLLLPGHLRAFGYAARLNGRIESAELNPRDDFRQPFTYLGLNIQEMFLTGRPQYPVERTLLVSGVLDALHESRHPGHIRIETPHLKVSYTLFEANPIRPDSPQ